MELLSLPPSSYSTTLFGSWGLWKGLRGSCRLCPFVFSQALRFRAISLVIAALMYLDVGHSLEHGKPTSDHILSKAKFSFLTDTHWPHTLSMGWGQEIIYSILPDFWLLWFYVLLVQIYAVSVNPGIILGLFFFLVGISHLKG